MSRVTYDIRFELSLERILPSLGQVVDTANDFMHGFGFPEKLTVRSEPFVMTLTVERPLDEQETEAIAKIIATGLREQFPGCDPTCTRFQLT